jgi:NADPH:quinone reductase-like Zn-dependent oxidoreductase
MKCVVVKAHGGREEFDDIIHMTQDQPRPARGSGQLLLRVQACSLAPGDVRTMSGKTKFVQAPASGFPYIPGGDVAGIVAEADPECSKFKVGDCVIARFAGIPSGGLGQYCAVRTSLAALKPDGISVAEAAALPASGIVAVIIVEKWVKAGDRVLVLGATGGVGSHVVQLLKRAGASFVAATAQIPERLDPKHVDRIINYTHEDWWQIDEFKAEKFDLILDFAGFDNSWLNCSGVLKDGLQNGRYITTVGDTPEYPVLNCCDVCKLMRRLFCRGVWTSFNKAKPYYSWFIGGLADPIQDKSWAALFKAIKDKHLVVKVDPAGPFPFTEQGVRDAFRLQASRHVNGKVVIMLDDEPSV